MMPSMHPDEQRWLRLCRRDLLRRSGLGLGAIALGSLLGRSGVRAETPRGAADPLSPRPPHGTPRAKRVIYLHMIGAPSQIDLFDPKPALAKHDGEPCPAELLKGRRFAFIGGDRLTLAGSRYDFARHGRSGAEMSDLLPHLS